MKLKLTWLCWIGIIFPLFSHDAQKAFFEIQVTEQKQIKIQADFPWTLREALIQFDSTLLVDKQKQVWRTVFKRYVAQNFRIFNKRGLPLKFLSIEESTKKHSGHAIQYNFILEWGEMVQIENRLMFNINENQENYHKIMVEQGEVDFVTNLNSPNYLFKRHQKTNYYFIASVFVVIFLSLLLLQMQIKKN